MYSLFENILTSAAGTAYPSGTPEFTPGFKWGCVGQSLYIVFGVVLCRSLFVLLSFFFWTLSVLRFTA